MKEQLIIILNMLLILSLKKQNRIINEIIFMFRRKSTWKNNKKIWNKKFLF